MSRLLAVLLALVVAACSGTTGPSAGITTPGAASIPATTPQPTRDGWTEDLAALDSNVRTLHPNPFAIHPEAEWNAKLAELKNSLPAASVDQQLVQLSSLVALLDTHSALEPPTPIHAYEVILYPFADGWFAIKAKDPSLVGARLVSIGGMPAADVEAKLRPLVPGDNESGKLDALEGLMSFVEYLYGAGIVNDVSKPAYVFGQANGSRVTVNPPAVETAAWEQEFSVVGDLLGNAPEAVARRTEPVWTRLYADRKTFLISYNDYTESDLGPAIAAMLAALDKGTATRVVLDMRYLRGGNGSLADPLIKALVGDHRVNRPGGLEIIIGRENVSAGTVVASTLDARTEATFIGEQTPARADNFLCPCSDVRLRYSGFIVSIPTYTRNTGDGRNSIEPDFLTPLDAASFFSGQDPVLEDAVSDRHRVYVPG